jgi:spermidine synthase
MNAPHSRNHWLFIGAVFFISGALGLVYQVLWMKELRLLFGSTAQATATTLTAFFLGLALGGWAGGRLAPRLRNPLRAYGVAEVGIALAALLYFFVVDAYAAFFPALYRALGNAPTTFLIVKLLLGVVLFLPASCFMGATLPILGQHMAGWREEMGKNVTVLYALNTLGAMVGTYLAGFHLPLRLGFHRTYVATMCASALLGLLVIVTSRRMPSTPRIESFPVAGEPAISWERVRALAFLSGAVTLALEVLWTHMFAQVLHNSVYTFATVLIAFLAALALGAFIAHGLIRRSVVGSGQIVLPALLLAGSLLVALSPNLFDAFTRGLSYVGENRDFGSYQLRAFTLALGVLFLPTLFLGTVFPYLLKVAEKHVKHVGSTLGTLLAVNTVGAIVGSLLGGFLLLDTVGLWGGIRCVALVGLLSVFVVTGLSGLRRMPVAAGSSVLALLCVVPLLTGFGNPPRVQINPAKEQILEVWEGSSGITAVIKDQNGLRTKVNNHYTLGGSGAEEIERRQGMIPLLLHPHPERVFFLGLGTGITASAAMTDPVETQVTICELVPDAVTASRKYFGPYTRGLFQSARTRVLVEDGRTYLRGTTDTFDVIVADLFVPWQAGEGTLYSEELFETIRSRLRPGGLFAQWIPLYQMSRREFDIVVRTMMSVFPQVTLWRAEFSGNHATMALIGSTEPTALYPELLQDRLHEVSDTDPLIPLADSTHALLPPFLLGYCGNITAARDLFGDGPLATDDRPLIEYLAPITQRRVGAKKAQWFVGEELITFLEEMERRVPPTDDPFLGNLTEKQRGYVRAGFLVQKGRVFREEGKQEESDAVRKELADWLLHLSKMTGP